MNCAEFQRVLPDIIGGDRNREQELHLTSCSTCSSLVSDLDTIRQEARQLQASEEPSPRVWHAIQIDLAEMQADFERIAEGARSLQASEEPSPRVWNSIEIALRQEGLIRQPQREPLLTRRPQWRWKQAWLLPVAAILLVAVGAVIYRRPHQPQVSAETHSPAVPLLVATPLAAPSAKDDAQLLETVASRSPAMREAYAANLQSVNDYIRDAQDSIKADPNDEEVQQSLIAAYEQKTMVYEMAMDRSLP